MMNQTPRRGANQSKYPLKGAFARGHGAGNWLRGDLKAYVDGELPGWRQRLMAWHVARCVSCRDEAMWLKQMSGNFTDWENDHSPLPRPELRTRILACLPADPPLMLTPTSGVPKVKMARRRAPRYAFRPTLALGSMAAIVLLMVGAFAFNLRQRAHIDSNAIPREVVEAAPPSRKVLMVFTAREDSFTADNSGMKAMSIEASPSGSSQEADDQAKEAGTSAGANIADNSGANGSSPSATAPEALPSDAVYTDPTSREAERRASLAIGKMLSERRQSVSAAKRESHSSQRAAVATTVKTSAPQMALAVADVAEARQQIQQWADTTGAQLRVMAAKSNSFSALTPTNPVDKSGTLLELRVPAPYARDFQAHISQLGTPLHTSDTNHKHLRPIPMQGAVEAAEPNSSQSLPAPGSTNADGSASGFVTLRVRLLPGETPPRQ